MSSPAEPVRPSRRWWVPALLLVAAASGIGYLWFAPEDALDRPSRVSLTMMASLATLILIWIWILLLANLALAGRLTAFFIAIACVVASIAAIRRIEFTGDMMPIAEFRWQPTQADIVEADRAHAAGTATGATLDFLPGEAMPEYRGKDRTGVILSTLVLPTNWSAKPPKRLWRQAIGGGYAAFAIQGNQAVTIEQRRGNEAIVSYDVATGAEQWKHEYPALFSEVLGGPGPRATPTIVGDKVYSFGATGILKCLELKSGNPRWTIDVLKENGVSNIDWGMAGSPLVFDDVVVVNPGSGANKIQGTQKGSAASAGVIAFHQKDGTAAWKSVKEQASYASPQLETIAARRQILIFDAEGLAGLDARTGTELWRSSFESPYLTNAAQPIVLSGNRIFITSARGSRMIELKSKGTDLEPVTLWEKRTLKGGYSCPIAKGGFIYGLDEGILVCLDEKTGERKWKNGRYGHGQMLLEGDTLIILSEKGELALVWANPGQFNELGKIAAIEGKTWNNPAMVSGYLFVRNHLEMSAFDLR